MKVSAIPNIGISNKGEIDIKALMLLGASTKRDDATKIGMFGSGIKYALAVLLKNKIPIKIYSGTKELKITIKEVEFRDQKFEQILIDGRETSITTELGLQWEPWFALREILCNAIDEGDHEIDVLGDLKPREGYTTIYIGMVNSMETVLKNWQDYFCEKRTGVIQNKNGGRVFVGGKDLIVYRKGIRCHYEPTKCLYHYDFDWININESRVIKDQFTFRLELVKWWAANANEEMISNLYNNFDKTYEGHCDWDWSEMDFNSYWLDIIKGRSIVMHDFAGWFKEEMSMEDCLILPASLCRSLKRKFGDKVKILGSGNSGGGRITVKPNEHQLFVLNEVLEFMKKIEIEIDFDVEICKFQKSYILGEAADNKIYLSTEVFKSGKREVAMTLLEEMMHLKSQAGDGTRRFQTYILNEFLFAKEKSVSIYL